MNNKDYKKDLKEKLIELERSISVCISELNNHNFIDSITERSNVVENVLDKLRNIKLDVHDIHEHNYFYGRSYNKEVGKDNV